MKTNLKTFPEYDEVFIAEYLADVKHWFKDFEAELLENLEKAKKNRNGLPLHHQYYSGYMFLVLDILGKSIEEINEILGDSS